MLYMVVSRFLKPNFTSKDDQCMLEKNNSCADCSMARFTYPSCPERKVVEPDY